MSRLTSMSPKALRAVFAPESDDTLVVLLTFSGSNIVTPIRLADNYNQRLSETDEDIIYGLKSRGNDFMFLPFEFNLPTEDDSSPRATLSIHDVNKQILPLIRSLTTAPSVNIELVLASDPNVVEVDFGDFLLSNIRYNQETITGDLVLESFENEPFPSGTFTPSYFPGLF